GRFAQYRSLFAQEVIGANPKHGSKPLDGLDIGRAVPRLPILHVFPGDHELVCELGLGKPGLATESLDALRQCHARNPNRCCGNSWKRWLDMVDIRSLPVTASQNPLGVLRVAHAHDDLTVIENDGLPYSRPGPSSYFCIR